MIQHVSETVFVHLRLIETECPVNICWVFLLTKEWH